MKKLFGLLLMLGLTWGLMGCSDGLEDGSDGPEKGSDGPEEGVLWDILPFSISMVVENQDGKDLLNPETEGNIVGDGCYAQYKGESYLMKDAAQLYDSRAIPAVFEGLVWYKRSDGKYMLCFGEFQSERTFENETFVIHWGDGTEDTISFSSKMTWKNHEPVFVRSYNLNETEVDSLPIKIVK